MRNFGATLPTLLLAAALAAPSPVRAARAAATTPASVESAETPASQDSAARGLEAYLRVVDSLGHAAAKYPPDSVIATLPCASTATRLCAADLRDLLAFLGGQEAFAVFLLAELKEGALHYEDYAHEVLPRLRESLARQDAFSNELARHPISRAETAAWNAHAQPLLAGSFLAYAAAGNTLLERKYFATGDEGNYLEGLVNSWVGFTRAEPDPSRAGLATFGVSPWEILFRAEPVYLVRNVKAGALGGMLTMGLLRHLFPSVSVTSGGEVEIREGFGSRRVGRMGLKGGFGWQGEDLHPMAGGALQVGAFSLWGTYSLDEERADIALGLADLGVLAGLLPVFD